MRLQQPQEQHWPVVHGTSVCDILAFICCDVVVNVYEQCGERVTVATAAREMSPLLSFSFQMPRDDLCWQPEAHGFEWVFFVLFHGTILLSPASLPDQEKVKQ